MTASNMGLFFSVLYLAMAIRYSVKRMDIFNPVFLFIIPYVLCYFVYFFIYSQNHPVCNETAALYILSMGAYLFGVRIYEISHRTNVGLIEKPATEILVIHKNIINLFIAIGIIGFLLGLYQVLRLGFSGLSSFLTNVRIHEIQGGGRNFITKYGSVLLYVATLVDLYNIRVSGHKFQFRQYFLIALLLGSVLFTMARTELLTYCISIAYMMFVTKKTSKQNGNIFSFLNKYYKAIILAAVFIVVFVWIGNNSGRQFATSWSDENFALWGYSGHGFVNLDYYAVREGYIDDWWSLLTPIEGMLSKVFKVSGVTALGTYINNNFSSFNTFTSIGAEYMAIGFGGTIVVNVIYAYFCAWLYKKSIERKGYYQIFYSSYIYTMVISFFAYQALNTFYIYVFVFLWIIRHVRIGYLAGNTGDAACVK